jgi:hypothetical protein
MTKRNSRPAVLHVRKLKGESGTNLPSLSQARLKELIEEGIVDAYGEEEQASGFFTMIEEPLALPFSVKGLGVDADVEKVDMTLDGQIVATCRRGKTRPKIPILDLCQQNSGKWTGSSRVRSLTSSVLIVETIASFGALLLGTRAPSIGYSPARTRIFLLPSNLSLPIPCEVSG